MVLEFIGGLIIGIPLGLVIGWLFAREKIRGAPPEVIEIPQRPIEQSLQFKPKRNYTRKALTKRTIATTALEAPAPKKVDAPKLPCMCVKCTHQTNWECRQVQCGCCCQ